MTNELTSRQVVLFVRALERRRCAESLAKISARTVWVVEHKESLMAIFVTEAAALKFKREHSRQAEITITDWLVLD